MSLARIDDVTFNVLRETLYPGAKEQSIKMVIEYCKARKLNPLLKPVHLVPMNVKSGRKDSSGKDIYEWRDVVMPGIGQYRIDAARSGEYAGMTEPEFGEDITEKVGNITLTYPKWCKVTVKKVVGNQIAEFTAKEYWKENYATKGRSDSTPNAMWEKRSYGQLAKCAEAQALRKAFPDVVGQEYTKEEMEGKFFPEQEHKVEVIQVINDKPLIEKLNDDTLDNALLNMSQCDNVDDLQGIFTHAYKQFAQSRDKESLQKLILAKDKKKQEIEETIKSFNDEIETGEVKS
jgi:phage recombination protein Bet